MDPSSYLSRFRELLHQAPFFNLHASRSQPQESNSRPRVPGWPIHGRPTFPAFVFQKVGCWIVNFPRCHRRPHPFGGRYCRLFQTKLDPGLNQDGKLFVHVSTQFPLSKCSIDVLSVLHLFYLSLSLSRPFFQYNCNRGMHWCHYSLRKDLKSNL